MIIHFVGPGGGRRSVSLQPKGFGTGGFAFPEEGLYVDPGPAALYKARLQGLELESFRYLYISHNHLDHMEDANAIAESMNALGKQRRATLLAGKEVLEGCGLTAYHKGLFRAIEVLEEGKQVEVAGAPLRAVAVHHGTESYGFVWKGIAYTSDTAYREGLGKRLSAKVLIANALWPRRGSHRHLGIEDVVKLVREGNHRVVVINHIGYEGYSYLLEKGERELLRPLLELGVEVYLAKEGWQLEL